MYTHTGKPYADYHGCVKGTLLFRYAGICGRLGLKGSFIQLWYCDVIFSPFLHTVINESFSLETDLEEGCLSATLNRSLQCFQEFFECYMYKWS